MENQANQENQKKPHRPLKKLEAQPPALELKCLSSRSATDERGRKYW